MALMAPDNFDNPESYIWTGHVDFAGEQDPNLISIEGFRTLLENTYDIRLADCKKPSYVRTREWLYAIWKKFPKPPKGYRGTEATWKYVISLFLHSQVLSAVEPYFVAFCSISLNSFPGLPSYSTIEFRSITPFSRPVFYVITFTNLST